MKKHLGIIGLLIVTIIWGGGFVVSDIALETLSPFQIISARFLLATLLLFPITVRHLKDINKEEIKAGIYLGIFLFAGFAFQTVGLKYTTPSKNAFLTSMNVVFVPIIAFIIYKKKVSPGGIVGVIMAVIGAGILSLNNNMSLGIGDTLTLICAICFAVQIFLTGIYAGKYRILVLNFIQMGVACALSFIFLLIMGETQVNMTRTGTLSLLYLGVVSTTVCYLLQTISQRYVDETKTAIILSMEAVFGCIFSIIFLHEHMTARMFVGSALILGAVLVSQAFPQSSTKSFKEIKGEKISKKELRKNSFT